MRHCIKVVISYSTDKALRLEERIQSTSTLHKTPALLSEKAKKSNNFLENGNAAYILCSEQKGFSLNDLDWIPQ